MKMRRYSNRAQQSNKILNLIRENPAIANEDNDFKGDYSSVEDEDDNIAKNFVVF